MNLSFNPNGASDASASHQAADRHYPGANLLARLLTASGEETSPL